MGLRLKVVVRNVDKRPGVPRTRRGMFMDDQATTASPGWYVDARGATRWWDGVAWTPSVAHPALVAPAAASPGPSRFTYDEPASAGLPRAERPGTSLASAGGHRGGAAAADRVVPTTRTSASRLASPVGPRAEGLGLVVLGILVSGFGWGSLLQVFGVVGQPNTQSPVHIVWIGAVIVGPIMLGRGAWSLVTGRSLGHMRFVSMDPTKVKAGHRRLFVLLGVVVVLLVLVLIMVATGGGKPSGNRAAGLPVASEVL